MNTQKKVLRIIAALLAMMLLLSACGAKPAATEAQIANPVSEVTADEMAKQAGVTLNAPSGAENVRYFVINGQPKVAQVEFSLNGKAYTYRGAAAQMDATALSGVYFGNSTESSAQVGGAEGQLLTEGKTAVLFWQDAAASYTLACTECDDAAVLVEIAGNI